MSTRYRAASGARLTHQQAQVVGETLESLGDEFTPADVLKVAKAKKSPLHTFFEWDDTEAAKEHRLEQARGLVRSVRVVITTPNGMDETRAFHSVRIHEEEPHRAYAPTTRILSDAALSDQVIERARSELIAWKRKYESYSDIFGPVIQAIGTVEKAKAV